MKEKQVKKNIVLVKTGGLKDSFEFHESQIQEPADNEILVKVDYAGVAFADVMMRLGQYSSAPKLPFTPGYDICGIVIKSGNSVTGLKSGDKVIALTQFGGYSNFTTVDFRRAAKIPFEMNSAEAVALVLNYISAHQMLTRYRKLKPGSKILIHSAAGGVGTALLQIAKAMDIKTYGTCSKNKVKIVEENGGISIDYTSVDFVQKMNELLPNGLDMIFDPIGGNHWLKSRKVLKPNGLLVGFGIFSMFEKNKVIGNIKNIGKFFAKLYLRNILPGSRKFSFYNVNPNDYRSIQKSFTEILALYQAGKVKPIIFKEYNLPDVISAHIDLGDSKSFGKIVLKCSEG